MFHKKFLSFFVGGIWNVNRNIIMIVAIIQAKAVKKDSKFYTEKVVNYSCFGTVVKTGRYRHR